MYSAFIFLALLRWTAAAPIADSDASVLSSLRLVKPTSSPTNINQASAALSSIYQVSPTPTNLFAAIGQLSAQGLTANNVGELEGFVDGIANGQASDRNFNLLLPRQPIYPKAERGDAPYMLNEAALRQAIYIPPTFRYGANGAPQPCVLVPGTGNTGYTTFIGNLYPLLQGSSICDPVL
jgi:hypothetical protein